MPEYTHTMLATLGGQPQVVTFTLDLLLRNHFPIHEVFVIHPRATDLRIQHALVSLRAEFADNRYHIDDRIIECRFSSQVLRLDGTPLEDIVDEASANGAHQTIYGLIRELKQHHVEQPVIESAKVLSDGGHLVLEMANSHARVRDERFE